MHDTSSSSAFMHWAFPTLARNLFMETCFCLFLIKKSCNKLFVMQCHPHNCGWCIILTCVHGQMASSSQYALPPQSFHKQAQAVSLSYAQSKAGMNHPQKNWTIDGCLECYTYCIMALGWLNKEEKRKKNNSDFQPFQVCHLLLLLLQTRAGPISCLMYF